MKKVFLISLFSLVFSMNIYAKCTDTININFNNLKIEDFVKMVAKISHKNILIDKDIKGMVDFISVEPICKSQIYDLLLNILDTKGYSIRDTQSGFLKIIKNADAPRTAPPLMSKDNISEVQTAIISVKNVSVKNVLRQVNFLLSKYGKIGLSYDSNTVIVTDYPANIRSIRAVLNSLDKNKDMTVKFISLHRADAKNVYPKVKKIAGALFDKTIKTQKVEITYDDATNSIIMIGNRDNIDKLIPKIKYMDQSDDTIDKKMEIIHLANADCVDVVKILQKLLSDKSFGKTSSEPKTRTSVKGKKTVTTVLPSVSGKDKPTITVDTELNAIVVYATKNELKEIKQVIHKLDIERQQVYVVAKIFEISRNKAKQFGLKYGFGGGAITSNGILGLTGGLGGDLSSVLNFKSLLFGSSDTTSIDGANSSRAIALGIALDLYKNNNIANMVSEPTLLCVNNKESSLYAGKTESILTQASTGSSTTDTTRQNYSREDIGLTLKVKPRISSDNKVVLDIKVTLEDVIGGSAGLPTTTKRDVKTLSIVQNGETVIIGGLVKSKDGNNKMKVPLLGDIPILGTLFSHKADLNDKTDLVIMITPYVVNRSQDLQTIRSELGRLEEFSAQMAMKLENQLNSGTVQTTTQVNSQSEPNHYKYNPTPTNLVDEDY